MANVLSIQTSVVSERATSLSAFHKENFPSSLAHNTTPLNILG